MPIAARSAPNNGRVKEAKVSFCTQGTGKALNGNAKRDVNRRANSDERRDIREDIRQAKREDENKNIKREIRKGRREDKFGDKERNGKREGWERLNKRLRKGRLDKLNMGIRIRVIIKMIIKVEGRITLGYGR